jgi:hypothetical protein
VGVGGRVGSVKDVGREGTMVGRVGREGTMVGRVGSVGRVGREGTMVGRVGREGTMVGRVKRVGRMVADPPQVRQLRSHVTERVQEGVKLPLARQAAKAGKSITCAVHTLSLGTQLAPLLQFSTRAQMAAWSTSVAVVAVVVVVVVAATVVTAGAQRIQDAFTKGPRALMQSGERLLRAPGACTQGRRSCSSVKHRGGKGNASPHELPAGQPSATQVFEGLVVATIGVAVDTAVGWVDDVGVQP